MSPRGNPNGPPVRGRRPTLDPAGGPSQMYHIRLVPAIHDRLMRVPVAEVRSGLVAIIELWESRKRQEDAQ